MGFNSGFKGLNLKFGCQKVKTDIKRLDFNDVDIRGAKYSVYRYLNKAAQSAVRRQITIVFTL
jgi:hypothetical protein